MKFIKKFFIRLLSRIAVAVNDELREYNENIRKENNRLDNLRNFVARRRHIITRARAIAAFQGKDPDTGTPYDKETMAIYLERKDYVKWNLVSH